MASIPILEIKSDLSKDTLSEGGKDAKQGTTSNSNRSTTFSVDTGNSSFPSPAPSTRPTRLRSKSKEEPSQINTDCVLFSLKIVLGSVFFLVVLVSSVMSKLTLVSITDHLRHETWQLKLKNGSNATVKAKDWEGKDEVISLYWQLLVILMVPSCLTFLRCFFFGFMGKTSISYPWPRPKTAFPLGLVGAVVEVIALSTLVFLVLTELTPGVAMLALNGVFLVQILIDIHAAYRKDQCHTPKCPNLGSSGRHGGYNALEETESIEENPLARTMEYSSNEYGHLETLLTELEEEEEEEEEMEDRDGVEGGGYRGHIIKFLRRLQVVQDHYVVKVVAAVLQVVGVVGLITFWAGVMVSKSGEIKLKTSVYLHPLIGLPLCLLALSLVWSNKFQEAIARSPIRKADKKVSARYKSGLINSFVRILLYPFVTYVVFRYLSPFPSYIDPWCLNSTDCHISFSSGSVSANEMIVHITMSLLGYFVVWVSCTMTLSQLSVGLPLLLSTPVAVAIYYIVVSKEAYYSNSFPTFFNISEDADVEHFLPASPCIALLLWIGEVIALGFYICTKTNIILARDSDMFLTPHYDSVFLEQHTILNRQVKKGKEDDILITTKQRDPRMIFICSTMYRENVTEMKQMLTSIKRVALHFDAKFGKNRECCDRYESHIFFDGAVNANQIENFGLQLLSLLQSTLGVSLRRGLRKKTPYGFCLSWELGVTAKMPFCVHFKDKTLVKPKKRWSQVMYMNYVINHRIRNQGLNPDNTFILTTDADIDFKAKSVVVLLDMLASDMNVAAVCARTHPKGQGLIYWYQLFDYAIGHWFQKPAEHILGSVLCSPGCFSVFRCSALKQVLEEYSTEVTSASDFLKKDMGEDRWLCTLLVKQGLRLEYCAISEDYTYCPTEFEEFYKQRRRWIPSTIANLVMLVSESGIITRGNDSISFLYILFQCILIFSTAISPATVILIIAAGLDTFSIPYSVVLTIFSLISFLYGLICLYASPKTQLDVAKLLTFVFSLVMSVVVIGIFKDIIDAIVPAPTKTPIGPPQGCSQFGNQTQEYEDCMKAFNFAANFTNGLYHHFSMPISFTVVYMGVLGFTFTMAGICHFRELGCLLHSIWYLLGLPSGYLLLLIYSAANLCDRSWGTREQNVGGDEGLWGWRVYVIWSWNKLTSLWCCVKCCWGGARMGVGGGGGGDGGSKKGEEQKEAAKAGVRMSEIVGMNAEAESEEKSGEEVKVKAGARHVKGSVGDEDVFVQSDLVHDAKMDYTTRDWLLELECEEYIDNFKEHGYTTRHFIADMTLEDFEAIGIDKRGFRLRLERAAKKLKPLRQQPGENFASVFEWLRSLELEEYSELFHHEGYKEQSDIPNMKQLDETQLKRMGVVKRGHIQRLIKAIEFLSRPPVHYSAMDHATLEWLRENDCEEYAENFAKHGYTNKHFISGVEAKDLEEIGVDKKGFRLRLQKAAQKLEPLNIRVDIPASVEEWLRNLELSEYTSLFHKEGYKSAEDIENLKDLDQTQLKAMGITKKAHLQRLKFALASLALPSQLEKDKKQTKTIIESMRCTELEDLDDSEANFWKRLIKEKLKPVSIKFTQNKDVHKSLESLRNSVLALLLLINLMWIVLLSSLTFWQLELYNIDPRAFQLLFLAVYGFIIIVQFITMLAHRAVTLVHYLGRVKSKEISVNPWANYAETFQVVSVRELA